MKEEKDNQKKDDWKIMDELNKEVFAIFRKYRNKEKEEEEEER